jgi:hypothetical protein
MVFDLMVTNGLGTVQSTAAILAVTATQPAVGADKRQLAGLMAATYSAGCINGAGQGPIVVAPDGDVVGSAVPFRFFRPRP